MYRSNFNNRGFTLIEILVTLAIVAILAAIALPAYGSFIQKGKIRAGQADLMAMVVNMESYYQRTLSYPSATIDTASTKAVFTGWTPAQGSDFNYSIQSVSGTSYSLMATGISQALTDCTLTISSNNTRSMTASCGGKSW